MRVGIIFIATGKYYVFAKGLIESFEKYFLTGHEKEYFVFTDNENPDIKSDSVHFIRKEKEKWPFDSLNRFKDIYKNKNLFSNIDFIFFTNANMKAVKPVEDNILPVGNYQFSAVLHPGYFTERPDEFPYERNEESLAFIPYGQGEYYYQGCFFGGKKDEFLEMSKTLAENTRKDLDNDIIAKVIDESHMNRYFLDKKVFPLPPVFSYPEQIIKGKENRDPSQYSTCASYIELAKRSPIIIQIDKRLFGGHDFLRK